MAGPQKKKSELSAKLGAALHKAHEAHKNDPVELGNTPLPAGIRDGVARLVEAKFDKYKTGDNTGQYYLYLAGTVVEPETHEKVKVKGLRTSQTLPVCPTKGKTFDDNYARMLNELKKLGLDVSKITGDMLEDAVAALKQSQPHFRFRTSLGKATPEYPNPRTFENWDGVVDYTSEGDGTEGVSDDGTGEADEPTPDEVTETVAEYNDGMDLTTLAAHADEGDEDAATRLTVLAKEAGMTDKQIEGAGSWSEIAEAIGSGGDDGDDQEGDETNNAEWQPEKDDLYTYKPHGRDKVEDVQVTAVHNSSRTVDLVSKSRVAGPGKKPAVYKGVSWDSLGDAS